MSGPRASFFAAGRPVTQGSKTIGRARSGRVFLREDAKGLKAWRDTLTAMAARTAGRVGVITGPGASSNTFWWRRCNEQSRSPRCTARPLPSPNT